MKKKYSKPEVTPIFTQAEANILLTSLAVDAANVDVDSLTSIDDGDTAFGDVEIFK